MVGKKSAEVGITDEKTIGLTEPGRCMCLILRYSQEAIGIVRDRYGGLNVGNVEKIMLSVYP